jgi:glycosyltransferase involved in cell wall biosynthesis
LIDAMLIGIDGRPLGPMKTGIGTYLSEMLRQPPFSSNAANIHLFSHRPIASPVNQLSLHVARATYGLPWYLFRSHRDINRFNLGVFWGSQSLVPAHLSATIPSVITIHDCVHQAGWVYAPSLTYNLLHRYFLPRAVQRSSKLLAVSSFVADEIRRYYDVPLSKLEVIPLGVSSRFRSTNIDVTRISQALTSFQIEIPFMLWVGTLEPRKNLAKLLEAFALLPSDLKGRLQLVLVGKKGWGQRKTVSSLKVLSKDCRVLLTGYVAEETLPYIYAAADAFVFPSLYEGFGLPVLEAMAAGCAVIASNIPSLKEIVGKAGVTLDPTDPAENWSKSIAKVLRSPELRRQLRASGFLQAEKYRWDNCAMMTYDVFRAIAR